MRLPLDCQADYVESFLDPGLADDAMESLSSLARSKRFCPTMEDGHRYRLDFGKVMFLDRSLKERDRLPEAQWGPSLVWPSFMEEIKARVERHSGQEFQVCVMIYYPDGSSGVDFHSDLSAFGDIDQIVSLSLGEERRFVFRHRETLEEYVLQLAHGSLLWMGDGCQEHYEHSLPVDPSCENSRINLTFRKFGFNDR